MFIGHYGVSFALKRAAPRVSLGTLFLAVQFVDILWAIFIPLGIEKARVVPHFLAASPLDLYYMPYTHSLVGALFWSVVAGAAYFAFAGKRRFEAAIVAVAVFSHFVLDLVAHGPDLALYDSKFKMGLGLWNYLGATFAVEALLVVAGVALWLTAKPSRDAAPPRKKAVIVFAAVLIAIAAGGLFGGLPGSIGGVAIFAEVSYWVLAGVAFWIDRPAAA